MTQTSEAAKLLSTIFLEEAVRTSAVGMGATMGVLSVFTLWAWLGEHFTSFRMDRHLSRRAYE